MQKQKVWTPFLFLTFICLLFIMLGKSGWLRPLQSGIERVTTPVKMSFYREEQRVLGVLRMVENFGKAEKKIAELEKEILASQEDVLRNKILEEENKALRQQLEAPLPPQMKFLPAKTLGLTRYLRLDKGEEDGVSVGQTVVFENLLVGKIKAVTPRTSQVIQPLDPDSKIPVRTVKTNARGLLLGEFGTKAALDKVLQSERLEKDDLLATTGEAGYQRDLLVGEIGNIIKNEVEPFQKAKINLLLDYSRLENVFIVK